MGKFRNQKKNLLKNKVATSVGKVKEMKKTARLQKKDGEVDVVMGEETERVRGLSVASMKKLAAGELENVPKVNPKKHIRKFELPVKENKKVLDVPSRKRGTTAQFITKKKAKKMYKKMTHDARDAYKKLTEGNIIDGALDTDGVEMEE